MLSMYGLGPYGSGKLLLVSLLLFITSIASAEPKLIINREIDINDRLRFTNVLDVSHRGHKDSYSISSVSSISFTFTDTIVMNLKYLMKCDYTLLDKPSDSISQTVSSTINFHF